MNIKEIHNNTLEYKEENGQEIIKCPNCAITHIIFLERHDQINCECGITFEIPRE